jgi:hypothetical protein
MISEEAYFWSIRWAGTWMLTRTRYTESAIKKEHPEALRVEGSRQVLLTPESPQERLTALRNAKASNPEVAYRNF